MISFPSRFSITKRQRLTAHISFRSGFCVHVCWNLVTATSPTMSRCARTYYKLLSYLVLFWRVAFLFGVKGVSQFFVGPKICPIQPQPRQQQRKCFCPWIWHRFPRHLGRTTENPRGTNASQMHVHNTNPIHTWLRTREQIWICFAVVFWQSLTCIENPPVARVSLFALLFARCSESCVNGNQHSVQSSKLRSFCTMVTITVVIETIYNSQNMIMLQGNEDKRVLSLLTVVNQQNTTCSTKKLPTCWRAVSWMTLPQIWAAPRSGSRSDWTIPIDRKTLVENFVQFNPIRAFQFDASNNL